MTSLESSYTYTVNFSASSFEEACEVTKKNFTKHGWGLPPGTVDLDYAKIFKAKGVDESFRKIHAFGFCMPKYAHHVLSAEPSAAVLLPCTTAVAEIEAGKTYQVSAINPAAMFQFLDHKDQIQDTVKEVDQIMRDTLDEFK